MKSFWYFLWPKKGMVTQLRFCSRPYAKDELIWQKIFNFFPVSNLSLVMKKYSSNPKKYTQCFRRAKFTKLKYILEQTVMTYRYLDGLKILRHWKSSRKRYIRLVFGVKKQTEFGQGEGYHFKTSHCNLLMLLGNGLAIKSLNRDRVSFRKCITDKCMSLQMK